MRGENRISGKSFVKVGILVTLAYFVWQVLWAVVTPPFQSPDEPLHFNSVLRVEATGEWPDPGDALVDQDVFTTVVESGFIEPDAQDFEALSRTRIAGSTSAVYTDAFATTSITEHVNRSVIEYGANGSTEIVDQMTQHPPLFYVAAAKVMDVFGAQSWTWDRQLLLLRVFSAFLTIPLIPCTLFTARKLGIGRIGSVFISVTTFAIPQLAFITGSLNNDSLAIGAGALTVAACAQAAFGKQNRWTVLAAGLALGLGLWSKGTFIPFGLIVALSFVVNPSAGRIRVRLVRGFAAGIIGVLTGGWWWLRNLMLFGTLQPEGYQTEHLREGKRIWYFISKAVGNLSESSWGRFGWLNWNLPWVLLTGLALFTLWAVAHSLVHGHQKVQRFVLLGFYPLTIAMLFVQAWNKYRETGTVPGTQGRYLFPAVVALIVIAGAAWLPALRRLATRRSQWVFALPSVIAPSIAVFAAWAWAHACYPSTISRVGINWMRWSEVAGFDVVWLKLLLAVAILLVVASAAAPCVLMYQAAIAEAVDTAEEISAEAFEEWSHSAEVSQARSRDLVASE